MSPNPRISLPVGPLAKLFSSADSRVFKRRQIEKLLESDAGASALLQKASLDELLEHLLSKTKLRAVRLALPHRAETLYVWGDVSLLAVASGAKAGAYLTHYTAMSIHELTDQVPKTIYVNVEQRPHVPDPDSLTQESIDRAFRNAQRTTKNVVEHEGHRLMFLNGRFTRQLGVIDYPLASGETVRVTDLERTLIDIAVRPAYSGGVAEVSRAYSAALARIDVARLAGYLQAMDFVYPYEQVVGYYLERAGAKPGELEPFRREPFRFDFYLAHGMRARDIELVSRWRLFVPKGF